MHERVHRAAAFFRQKHSLPSAVNFTTVDYLDTHDAIHQFLKAGPEWNDDGETMVIAAHHYITDATPEAKRKIEDFWPEVIPFKRRYGHLFVGAPGENPPW